MDNVCPKCKGTGFEEKVRKDGKEYVIRCDCQAVDRLLTLSEKANIPRRFAGATLAGFIPNSKNPTQAKAKKIIEQLIEDYPAIDKGILFQGSTGVGKTHLLSVVATELLHKDENIDIYYIDWNDLVRQMLFLASQESSDFTTINKMVAKLAQVDFLLFDELGASRVKQEWIADNIYYLMNSRYNNSKITVCASNFFDSPAGDQETLTERIGVRMRSRLYEMTRSFEIKGTDFRREHLKR